MSVSDPADVPHRCGQLLFWCHIFRLIESRSLQKMIQRFIYQNKLPHPGSSPAWVVFLCSSCEHCIHLVIYKECFHSAGSSSYWCNVNWHDGLSVTAWETNSNGLDIKSCLICINMWNRWRITEQGYSCAVRHVLNFHITFISFLYYKLLFKEMFLLNVSFESQSQ